MATESPLPQTPGPEAARLLKLASDHIADYFDALPPEQQDTPSGADGWALGDLLAHMSGGAEGAIRDVSRALKGDAGPLPEAPFRKTGPDPEGRARGGPPGQRVPRATGRRPLGELSPAERSVLLPAEFPGTG